MSLVDSLKDLLGLRKITPLDKKIVAEEMDLWMRGQGATHSLATERKVKKGWRRRSTKKRPDVEIIGTGKIIS